MPKALEKKLKQEYGQDSAIPYKIMNKMGVMRGNKETDKGRAMDRAHQDQHTRDHDKERKGS